MALGVIDVIVVEILFTNGTFYLHRALMDVVHELIPLSANIILSLSALPAAFHLFRVK